MTSQRLTYAAISQREPFRHETLKLSENSIRLFQVHPGLKDEPISIGIRQYSITRRPKYIAISYTWGSVVKSSTIAVNGRSFQVHSNLWNLLYQLRQRKETCFLWADRMCIDQENLAERNFHVQLMGKIYDHASSAIVWLGIPSADRTEIRAMDFVKEIVLRSKQTSFEKLSLSLLAPECQHRWETLLRMCHHSYWSRTWIVQEFIRAPSIEVLCGTASINWTDFETLLDLLRQELYVSHNTVMTLLQTRPARLTIRRHVRSADTLYELLQEFHDSQCKERRDKIYGILGLASDCVQQGDRPGGIKADYKKHIVEVYFDTVKCMMHESLTDKSFLPSAANLARRALLLAEPDFANYILSQPASLSSVPHFNIIPGYISTVRNITSWTSISSLRQKLETTDWGAFLGYEVRSSTRPAAIRRTSRIAHPDLPDDLIKNAINVAETEDLNCLYNYPDLNGLHVAPDTMLHHTADKRALMNEKLQKPSIFLEQCTTTGSLRVGFACTNTRNSDLVLQFPGLDYAVIVRRISFEIKMVGKAVLCKHMQLDDGHSLDGVCEASPWFSACPKAMGSEMLELETDALSLVELLGRD